MKKKLFSILAILMMALTAQATGYRVIGTAINPPSTVPSDFKEVTKEEAWAYGHSFTGTVCWLVIYAKDGNNYKFVRKAEWGEDEGTNTWENIIYGESGCYPDPLQVSLIVPYEDAVTVTGVTLSQAEAALNIGESVTLTATVLPDNATDKTVTWASSDPAVATVADGVVTAVAAGTATITVTTTDGAKTATCTMTVAEPTYNIILKEGTEDAANWTVSPNPATEGQTVTVTYSGTKKVKSIKAVRKAPATIAVTAITLNKTETEIKVGSTETLSVTAVAPDNATDKTYTWKTTDATIATVTAEGVVTAVAEGTVTIYAEANDGSGVKGNCTVTVTSAVPEYYNKLTKIDDSYDDQVYLLKQFGRGRQAYNSSLTAAQAYALATYQAAIDGKPVYVIMSSQEEGYEIHYAVSTDAAATEHTSDLYDICYESNPVRMYYVAQ